MRLLLTADLHLTAEHPERLRALEQIVDRGAAEDIDYLLIAGDLFDADVDVEDVKPDVRDIFSDNDFQTLAIPGNHDQTAYREEDHFGDDIEILKDTPFTQRQLGPITLTAVPYFDGDFTDIIDDLETIDSSEDTVDLLLLHCTLAGLSGGFGTESRYLPVTPEQLLQLPFDYVFAGHIHTSPTKQDIDDDTVFVYPGSPASITRSETGRRGVWLLDTDDKHLQRLDLDTFHYESIQLDLQPGNADAKLDTLADRLADKNVDSAHLLIEPVGFIEQEEDEFFDRLDTIVADADPMESDIDHTGLRSAQSVIQTDLYQKFQDKLEEREDIDQTAVERIALDAFLRYSRG